MYKDFSININSINDPNIYNLGCEIRDTCNEIKRKQFKQLSKLLIPLCLESHDGCYFNILWMITLCSRLYLQHEIYAMEYNKEINYMYDHLFIKIQLVSGVMMVFGKIELGKIIAV